MIFRTVLGWDNFGFIFRVHGQEFKGSLLNFPFLLVGGGEKGYQNGGEVVPCQGSSSE